MPLDAPPAAPRRDAAARACTPAAPPARLAPGSRRALAGVIVAMVLVVIDGTIVNVALPSISSGLAVSPSASIWVVTAYQLALVMALFPSAALGDRLGHGRVFTAGVAMFTLASALCAFAPGFGLLVAARFVQGLSAASVMSLIAALLRDIVPTPMLGRAIGWNALTVALSSALGPTLGAVILSQASWHWLFAVNLPTGLLALFALRHMPRGSRGAHRVDLRAVSLNALAFGALVVGVDRLPASRAQGLPLLVVALLAFVALVRRERRSAAPLIPVDLLRLRALRLSVLASIHCFAAQILGIVALVFAFHIQFGKSAFVTGLALTPWPLSVAVSATLAGRLADRMSTAVLATAGATCLGAGLLLCAAMTATHAFAALVACTMLCGLGFGMFQVPNNRNLLLSAPRARSAAAGGMQATARLSGQTAGAVAGSVLFQLFGAASAPWAGLVAAACMAGGGALMSSLRMRGTGH